MAEPRCIEVTVSRSQQGNVALKDYGKHTSGYNLFFSRKYEIPEEWSEEDVDAFQLERQDHLRSLIDPLDDEEYESRVEQADPGIH